MVLPESKHEFVQAFQFGLEPDQQLDFVDKGVLVLLDDINEKLTHAHRLETLHVSIAVLLRPDPEDAFAYLVG